MSDAVPVDWTPAERQLWTRIEAHDFEPADQALHFTRRLARDRGWTLEVARAAILEYRRFCFLAMVAATPVTPSEEVDEVWHQHLTYSRDYWNRWCRSVLGAPLHHDPTRGGGAEQSRFKAQYAETLALYEVYFGPPDASVWPGTRERFRPTPRYRVVDLDGVIVVPCPPVVIKGLRRASAVLGLAALSSLAAGPASALPLNPLDWTAEPFLTLYGALAAVALAASWIVRRWVCDDERMGQPDGLDPLELAYLAGGPSRAADAVMVGLMAAGAARLDGKAKTLVVDARDAILPPFLEPFRFSVSGSATRADSLGVVLPWLHKVKMSLVQRHLAPSEARVRQARLATACLVGPVLLLGLSKLVVGLSREKPVGYLMGLMLLTGFCMTILIFWPWLRTREGDAALSDYRDRYGRAIRAPRMPEVMLAFALAGPAALAGTELAAYAGLIRSADGSGGGGGCGGGGGGGGGGCGGCGGGD